MQYQKKLQGALYVFLSAILYGSYGVWSVLLGPDFGTFFQAYVRAFLVLSFLIPLCMYYKSWIRIDVRDYKKFSWLIFCVIFTQAPIYYAYQHSGIGITNLIFFSTLLIVQFLFGRFLLKEKFSWIKIISLILALAGLFFVFKNSLGAFSFLALSMAILSGLASGAQSASTKLIPKKYSAIQISILSWGTSLITHMPISLYLGEKQLVPSFSMAWFYMLSFALCGLLTFILVIQGYKYIEASIGGLIGLLEVVFAIIFGYLFFHENLTMVIVFGGAVILFAAILPYMHEIGKKYMK